MALRPESTGFPFYNPGVNAAPLPLPSDDARAASRLLATTIRARIDAASGWLRFDHFMEAALYEPGLGYYAGGSRKFGAAGDFVTAPELSPMFGGCIATQCAQWLQQVPHQIVEFGAGTGALAAQVLNELARHGFDGLEYAIVERSPELRERQRQAISTLAPAAIGRVRWLDELPARIDGVVLANELLDALPVRLFRLAGGAVLERGVTAGGRGDAEFAWDDRPADPAFAAAVRTRLADAEWEPAMLDAADYMSEFGEQAEGWLRTIAGRLGHGVVLLLDYGFPTRELYHPQRRQGTLACHYRHHVHHDPLWMPGLQDITAHVDFGALARVGQAADLALLGYTSQAHFLLNCGLLDRLAVVPIEQTLAYSRQAQAVQRLVSEAEMGELFKVIALGRGIDLVSAGFVRGDRSDLLIE